MFHQFRGRKSWRKEVKLEAAKVMKPRSELNPGVWQGDCLEFERCCLTRRRGETRGEHLFRIGFRACKATQESQNLGARRQRRSYGFAARLTLGWKADQRTGPPRRTRGRLMAPGYFSQMVTGGAWTVPTVRVTAVSPGATKPLGMRALICSTPIMPGALPAYRMSAFSPAMINEIDSSGCG